MIGALIQQDMFKEEYDNMLANPINSGYGGLGTGIKIGMAASRVAKLPNKDLSAVQKIGNTLYMIGFALALLPIIIIRPNLVPFVLRIWRMFLPAGTVKTTAITLLEGLITKMASNFILTAILLPIFGLISVIFLIIGEAIGDVSKLDKSSSYFITPITTKEVIQKYTRATKLMGMKISEKFPMISSIFSFINNIFNKLHNAYRNIKAKVTESVKGSQEQDDAKMESVGIGKILGGAFFVGVIVMLLKKTKIGGFFALFVTMLFAMSKKAKTYVRKIPFMYDIFKAFKNQGDALSKRFNLAKLFQQFMEYSRNLKIVQSLYATFSDK